MAIYQSNGFTEINNEVCIMQMKQLNVQKYQIGCKVKGHIVDQVLLC